MWLRRNPARRRSSGGFVLIEVLVTAAVAAVLLVVVMRAFSAVWSGIGAVREETETMLVARAVIEAATPRANLAPGTQQGVIGRYAWNVAVVNTGVQAELGRQSEQQSKPMPQSAKPTPQSRAGRRPVESNEQPDDQQPPEGAGQVWTLFRIAVEIRGPSGRSTTVETYRLARAAQ